MPSKRFSPVVNPTSPDGLPAETSPLNADGEVEIPEFDLEWLKLTPNDRIRELTKAGALIAAEIDRLQSE